MNNLYFYLLLGVFLYFILTKILDNYLATQENFDPSLVPVSSIVTLAKVAQKIVNGNGTLTNPGSLQIGASTTAPGNLIVNGTAKVSGLTELNGGLFVSSGNTTGDALNIVQGSSAPNINFLANDGKTTYGSIQGQSNNLLLTGTQTEVSGNLKVNGSITSTGEIFTNNNIHIKGSDSSLKIHARDNSGVNQIYSDSASSGIKMKNNSNTVIFNIDQSGNLNVPSVSPTTATITGAATVETTLVVTGQTTLTGGLNVSTITGNPTITGDTTVTGNVTVNGVSIDEADKVTLYNQQNNKCLYSNGTIVTFTNANSNNQCDKTDPNIFWSVKPTRLIHVASGKCVTHNSQTDSFILSNCDRRDANQVISYNGPPMIYPVIPQNLTYFNSNRTKMIGGNFITMHTGSLTLDPYQKKIIKDIYFNDVTDPNQENNNNNVWNII